MINGNSQLWLVLGLLLVAAGVLVAAGAILLRGMRQNRSERLIEQVLANRQQAALQALQGQRFVPGQAANGDDAQDEDGAPGRARGWRALFDRAAELGKRWSETRYGQYLIADEDRILLAQCGYDSVRAKSLYTFSRVALMVALPVLVWLWFRGNGGIDTMARLFGAIGGGLMLPKLLLSRRASKVRTQLVDELPLLIDLLRLLQGVGLSMDQSLFVLTTDFKEVLPILAREFEIANRQYASGRGREASLGRLREVFDNDDLRALVRLIGQVERHGGAVQEPLQQFSDRLREARRQTMKERIGKLTVKMTIAMMVTLLPALLVVIAGPALLSLTKSMEALK